MASVLEYDNLLNAGPDDVSEWVNLIGPRNKHDILARLFQQLLCDKGVDITQIMDFELTRQITKDPDPFDSGGYAVIHLGHLRNRLHDGTRVALKFRTGGHWDNRDFERTAKQWFRELSAWAPLKHRNVLELLGLYYCPKHLPAFVSPFCGQGNLRQYLSENARVDRLLITLGITEGLQYLHRQGIIHGDLHPSNVLMNDGIPLLCDFGRSRVEGRPGFTTGFAGVCRYVAPELILVPPAEKVTKESDVYALSMVTLETISDKCPFDQYTADHSIIFALGRKERPLRESYAVEDTIWQLLENAWDEVPSNRPPLEMFAAKIRSSRYS